ncbi:MAG: hypothetical protein KDD52_03825 [Bdellovibrionales bacterium]|nr:hypothetical protein [Bdellovibrionales bacterium]
MKHRRIHLQSITKLIQVHLLALLIFILQACGTQVGSTGSSNLKGSFDSSQSDLKTIHYLEWQNILTQTMGLPLGSSAMNMLSDKKDIFENTLGIDTTKRFAMIELATEACKNSDEQDPSILFDDPSNPTIDKMWTALNGVEADFDAKDTESEILSLNFSSNSQKRWALCVYSLTSLYAVTTNISPLQGSILSSK